jgi:hypothetical protein
MALPEWTAWLTTAKTAVDISEEYPQRIATRTEIRGGEEANR